jgi:threonine/homoserine/homoserine lactone efflux protein
VLSSPAVALFVEGAVLGLSAAASPGPLQAYMLAQSVRNGAVRTLPVAAVPLVSDPPVIAIVLAVLAQVPAAFVRGLQLAGGAVVLWLAVGAIREAFRATPKGAASEGEPAGSSPRGVVRAIAVNLTNPSVWIFWSAIGGAILARTWHERPPGAIAFLAGFYACLVAGNVAFIVAAGAASRGGPRLARALGLASGLALLGFGVLQVGRGLAGAW